MARGERKADILFQGGHIVDVFSGTVRRADVSVADGVIVMVGPALAAEKTVDCSGQFLCPGFIDAHVHIESSLMTPQSFGHAVVPLGTTTVIADPHEIANVAGIPGIEFMIENARQSPLGIFFKAPSCVPATPLGTSGATLDADDLTKLLKHDSVIGLGEMMNFPGLVFGDKSVLDKMTAFEGTHIDGHTPGATGPLLQAYAGMGISTDHECMTADEMNERVALGMYILIREGSAAKNLHALLPALTPENMQRCAFCTDDRHPAEIISEGHINFLVREAVRFGIPAVQAIRLATLNAAVCFNLNDRGAIAPGKRADILILPDLKSFKPDRVFVHGLEAARDGRSIRVNESEASAALPDTFHLKSNRFKLKVPENAGLLNIIKTIPDQLLTLWEKEEPLLRDGEIIPDTRRDILKIAVVERHRATGNIGLGFIRGFGLKTGAIAGSVGHDAHNITVVGCDDTSMQTAIQRVCAMKGGLVAAEGKDVLAECALPVGGLMSEKSMEDIQQEMSGILNAAKDLGSPLKDPYMTLSFMSLEVIPELKLTDQGLVDTGKLVFVPLSITSQEKQV